MQPTPAHIGRNDAPMSHADWMTAARTEYTRLDELLAELTEDQWLLPTTAPAGRSATSWLT